MIHILRLVIVRGLQQERQRRHHHHLISSSVLFRACSKTTRKPVHADADCRYYVVSSSKKKKGVTRSFSSIINVQQQQQRPYNNNNFSSTGDNTTSKLRYRHFSSSSSSEAAATVNHHDTNKDLSDDDYRNRHLQTSLQLDFFGEPVSFLISDSNSSVPSDKVLSNAMAAYDGHVLAVVSKGKSCVGGGDESGLDIQSQHSTAIGWSQLLKFASTWNNDQDVVVIRNEEGGGDTTDSSTSEQQQHQRISSPMLGVVAVAPVLAQAGIAYLKHLDMLFVNDNKQKQQQQQQQQSNDDTEGQVKNRVVPQIQLLQIAQSAVSQKDDERLNIREKLHLQALECLLNNQHQTALLHLMRLLRQCPGDVLALSLAMDISQTLGDKDSALRAATTVSAYWNERRGGIIRPTLPGHTMASSLIALGLAVGNRLEEAEPLADRAMKQGRKVSGALATWSQAHIYDAGGRVAEGISALANFDGMTNYEGSGFLFFECRLTGYGSRFSLEREERGRGKSKALRLFDAHFGRILDYSGFAIGQPRQKPQQKAPLGWADTIAIEMGDDDEENDDDKDASSSSFFGKWFGRKEGKDSTDGDDDDQQQQQDYEIIEKGDHAPSRKVDNWEPTCEDVLTWIPPTPPLLSDATLLLFRFTLNGTISRKNARWDAIRKAWEAMLTIQNKHQGSLNFSPLVSVVASLLCPPSETGGDTIGNGRLAQGLYMFGEQLQLGNNNMPQEDESSTSSASSSTTETKAVRETVAEREPDFWLPAKEEAIDKWKTIVDHLISSIDGFDDSEEGEIGHVLAADPSLRFRTWDFEGRPITEHAIVYACCKVGDIEYLSLARSICSQGVTLRPNSPEEWWRYSIVLGLLGDDVASEDALNNSINVGGGQGARGG